MNAKQQALHNEIDAMILKGGIDTKKLAFTANALALVFAASNAAPQFVLPEKYRVTTVAGVDENVPVYASDAVYTAVVLFAATRYVEAFQKGTPYDVAEVDAFAERFAAASPDERYTSITSILLGMEGCMNFESDKVEPGFSASIPAEARLTPNLEKVVGSLPDFAARCALALEATTELTSFVLAMATVIAHGQVEDRGADATRMEFRVSGRMVIGMQDQLADTIAGRMLQAYLRQNLQPEVFAEVEQKMKVYGDADIPDDADIETLLRQALGSAGATLH